MRAKSGNSRRQPGHFHVAQTLRSHYRKLHAERRHRPFCTREAVLPAARVVFRYNYKYTGGSSRCCTKRSSEGVRVKKNQPHHRPCSVMPCSAVELGQATQAARPQRWIWNLRKGYQLLRQNCRSHNPFLRRYHRSRMENKMPSHILPRFLLFLHITRQLESTPTQQLLLLAPPLAL